MSDSDIALCNRVLTRLHVNQITSLDDASREARLLKANFEYLRDDVNGLAAWGFAMKQVELAQDATAPVWGAAYRYALPDDYLSFLRTKTQIEGGEETHRRHGDYLLTNAGSMHIEYCARITDLNKWTSLAKEALVERIMAELAPSLSGGEIRPTDLWPIYQEKLSAAIAYDAAEQTPRELIVDDYLIARHGGGGYGGMKVSDF